MRKVIFAINMSIDGCVDHTRFSPGEGVDEYFTALVRDVDLIAYGRKMYELMFPYWTDPANRDTPLKNEFAERITGLDKIVFSRTLASANYNTRIVNTDPVEELQKLKQAPGGNILVSTVSMLPQLAHAGEIDEYRFVVAPVIIGQGPRLVEDGTLAEKLNLELVATKTFEAGSIALHYKKRA
jgi:dihydrofolate reductase